MFRNVPMNLTKKRVVASMILLFVEQFSVALRIGTNEEWFWSFLNVLAEFVLRLGVFKNQTSRKTSKSRVHKFVKTFSASIIGNRGVILLFVDAVVGVRFVLQNSPCIAVSIVRNNLHVAFGANTACVRTYHVTCHGRINC